MAGVVANASVLIALSNIGQLDLLERVVGEVVILPAVAHEVIGRKKLPPWVTTRSLTRPLDARMRAASLHAGESAAVSLALELGAGLARWPLLAHALGHSNLQTTALYTQVEVEDLRAVIRRCHPRERTWGREA